MSSIGGGYGVSLHKETLLVPISLLWILFVGKIFYNQAERIRDPGEGKMIKNGWSIYHPYINVDKKFVADIFKTHNLMNTLFPL